MPVPDAITWAKPEDVGLSRERLGRVAARFDEDIADGTLPGAVALVARRGRIVHFKAQGLRGPESDDPMRLDTLFRIYSMTKPIVSAAFMILVEEGRLALDDPLSAFVPGFAEARVAQGGETVPAARPITLHDLLRHTSGLTYEWLTAGPVSDAYLAAKAGRPTRTNAEQAEVLASLPLLSQPGTAWDYGRSVDVLGRVAEIVSGRTLGAFLQERILEPLGMMETGFQVPPAHADRIAEPLPSDPDSGEPVRLLDLTRPAAMENGGGGLVSTASDFARFAHMVAAGGILEGTRVLSPATIDLMLADHLPPGTRIGSDLLAPGYGFGLGFAVRRQDGIAAFPGSAGDAYWMGLGGTSFWIDRRRELYAVLMVQAPGRRERYARLFRGLVYGALPA